MLKPKGYVIYEGKSELTNDNIVGIITMQSTNRKVGNIPNLWILPKDISPIDAFREQKDDSVCGDCSLRQNQGGGCYVTIFQAPSSVYKSYKRGLYPKLSNYTMLYDTRIRFGAYGDPSALPKEVLDELNLYAHKQSLAYTHQWHKQAHLKSFAMASTDSVEETILAHDMGWRTFRVTNDIESLLPNEIICPNTTKGINCITCGLCNGNKSKAKSIVIESHGSLKKRIK